VAPVAENVEVAKVCLHLNSGPLMTLVMAQWSQSEPKGMTEFPALKPKMFEALILQELKRFTSEELEHWFRYGCAPVKDEGEQIARELTIPPARTLTGVLEPLSRRGRLSGALPFVPQLVSALTLPPRRLAQRELPMGGYADVTTRGHPEQLLPSQFAVDTLEFIRRYAENEF